MKYLKHLLIIVAVPVILFGCSREGSFKVLSFFFDGVGETSKTGGVAPSDAITSMIPDTSAAQATRAELQYNLHSPYANHNCAACHDRGATGRLLQSQPGLCYKCHSDLVEEFKYIHGPVAGGYCTVCHEGHKSLQPNLLKRTGKDMCLYCHDASSVTKSHSDKGAGVSDCNSCHNPHGGVNSSILR